jgi:pimeloyl-ACP methyl ester carboxylesterase
MGEMEIMAVLKIIGALTAAVALTLLMTYWAAGRARTTLNADIRADLIKRGEAHHFIALPDGIVHYRLEGPTDGPLIVLVHGFSVSSFVWDDYFAPLTNAGFRVLAYDNYGRGFSDRPKGPYDADLSNRLLEHLLDKLAPDVPVNLVGYSMGGATATIYAARHPKQIVSMTLIAPAGLGTARGGNAELLKRPLIGDWLVRMFGLRVFHAHAAEEAKRAPNPAAFLAKFDRQMDYRGYGDALLSTLRTYPLTGAENFYAEAGAAARPVMVIWGEADTTVPFANAKTLMALMPHAKLYSFAKFGHAVTFSQAPLVINLIRQFLGSQVDPTLNNEPPAMRLEPRPINAQK